MRIYCRLAIGLAIGLLALSHPLSAQSEAIHLGPFDDAAYMTATAEGTLAHPGALQWYAFSIDTEDTRLFIRLEGADTRALLFDSNETYLAGSENGDLERALAAGAYLIRVDNTGSGATDYTLLLSNGYERESNEGIAEANDVGTVEGAQLLLGALLPAGDMDVFRFDISDGGLANGANALRIRTGGPRSDDTVLVLYRFDDDAGRYLPIALDDDSGNEYWSRLLIRPEPGARYAVRVEETTFPILGIDRYYLSLEPMTLLSDEEPNDTSATAQDLDVLSSDRSNVVMAGVLGGDDDEDFVRLTLESRFLLHASTEPQPGVGEFDTILRVYTSSGDLLAENDNSRNTAWSSISVPLEAGVYFISVESGSASEDLVPYALYLSVQSMRTVVEIEPNDTDETSQPIVWQTGEALLMEAAIDLSGDVDSFQFTLTEAMTLILETSPRAGESTSYDTTLSVFDEELWEVAYNDDGNGRWSRIESYFEPGTYYVVVESYFDEEAFDYTLMISEPQ